MLDGEREGGIDFDVLYGPHSLPGRQNSAVGHRARIRRRGIVIKRRGSVCVCVCAKLVNQKKIHQPAQMEREGKKTEDI